MFFLFSDILICSKKKFLDKDNCTYTCQRVFPLLECTVESLLGTSQETGYGGLFKITCREESILLMSTSQLEAMSWVQHINEEISKIKESRASLKTDNSETDEWKGKRDIPLRRSAVLRSKQKAKKVIAKLESYSDCASPRSKDSLYPMRKSLQPPEASYQMKPRSLRIDAEPSSSGVEYSISETEPSTSEAKSSTSTIYEESITENSLPTDEEMKENYFKGQEDDDSSSDEEETDSEMPQEENKGFNRTTRASTRKKRLTVKYNQVISPPPKYRKDDEQNVSCVNVFRASIRRTKSIRKKYL